MKTKQIEKSFESTSKPACFKASRHFPIVLISGSPLPISISAYGNGHRQYNCIRSEETGDRISKITFILW